MAQIQVQYNCPIKLTMDLIGGKWKITILWFLNEVRAWTERGKLNTLPEYKL